MSISIHAISTVVDISVCASIENIRAATGKDVDLQLLQAYIRREWPQRNDKSEPSLGRYCPIKDDLAMIDG